MKRSLKQQQQLAWRQRRAQIAMCRQLLMNITKELGEECFRVTICCRYLQKKNDELATKQGLAITPHKEAPND